MIFFSLLPMIVTPLVGSLILFWMIDSQGVIGATLQRIFNDPQLSLKASPMLTWVTLFVYGIWHNAPFSFVVFYAGLQTVPEDTLESAMIDGASRWERIRFVVIPHLTPLGDLRRAGPADGQFPRLRADRRLLAPRPTPPRCQLADLQRPARPGRPPLFGSAAATSMLTIIGVVILLSPVLIRTWREFNRKA